MRKKYQVRGNPAKSCLDQLEAKGKYHLQLIRNDVVITDEVVTNLVTTEGKNYILDSSLGGVTAKPTWYIGLISNAGPPVLSVADTLTTNSWTEFEDYSEGARQEWVDATTNAGSKTASSQSVFTVDAVGTVYGFFVASDSDSANNATATLLTVAAASAIQAVEIGDILKLTYTLGI